MKYGPQIDQLIYHFHQPILCYPIKNKRVVPFLWGEKKKRKEKKKEKWLLVLLQLAIRLVSYWSHSFCHFP